MIDCRQQIAQALETVCENVKMARPSGDVEFPLICYACVSNLDVNVAYARLKWRVTVYCNTFEEVVQKVKEIDVVMHDTLGYTRTYETPDNQAKQETDFYMKRLEYAGLVNKEINGVIINSR